MLNEPDSQQEPLDFYHSQLDCRCPYCGETLGADELEHFLTPEANAFICPNCRKRLNVHELGGGV